jgi:hypothetical protein
MEVAWNHWYHVMGNTYGTWLRGDQRGWRERHHRGHVDGDYKSPPSIEFSQGVHRRSKMLMNRDPVHLEKRLRWIALVAIIGSLRGDDVELLVTSLDDHHLHLLGRFRNDDPRRLLGWAKLQAIRSVKSYLKAHGAAVGLDVQLREGEGIWAKRSKSLPVRDRTHQVNVCGYIASHGKRGAAVFIHPSVEKSLLKSGKIKSPRPRRGL